jgi:hypothetical protein
MPKYRVYVRVEYEVEAESAEQASKIVQDGAEFPLTPFSETHYCDTSEVLLVHPITENK